MSERSGAIDARAARRRFGRAAAGYEPAARLESEVADRLRERLEYVKLAPRRILDAGSGTGRDARALGAHYRGAEVIALDYALPMLPRAGFLDRWRRRGVLSLSADMERLPLESESVQLVWSNMALHWLNDPLAAFREFSRVLVPDGLVMFSTLGPDTLKELRAAGADSRVHAFIDMHDLGDMLVAAGLTSPVMEMEVLTIDYRSGARLLEDLRASGQTNARADRPRGLAGRRFGERLRAALEATPQITYEVVYGHAWKPTPAPRDTSVKTVRVFKRIP
ncbi:MAG TPA: methyltransferase domain-containing protein [Burkholderiales bacterium]|nr:methyltransferase domain-containing protein [Burkholderiales bacterium]